MKMRIRRLPHAAGLPAPSYQSEHAAGMDLVAAVREDAVLSPGERALVPTGFSIEIPIGYEGQVRPRSGLALKDGVTVLNSPGTVDADYRGEIGVLLVNHGSKAFTVSRGSRIAQFVVSRVDRCELVESDELSGTTRGEKGFGSTGFASRVVEGDR